MSWSTQPLPNLMGKAGCQQLSELGAPGFSRSSFPGLMLSARLTSGSERRESGQRSLRCYLEGKRSRLLPLRKSELSLWCVEQHGVGVCMAERERKGGRSNSGGELL